MDESTWTFKVMRDEAPQVRAMLSARLHLRISEKPRWHFFRLFTVTGPASAVEAAKQEIEDWLADKWLEAQW